MLMPDYILNGEAHGEMASGFQNVGWDAGYFRPFFDQVGVGATPRSRQFVIIKTGRAKKNADGSIVYNKQGKTVPETEQVRIKDLQDNGVQVPVWNATVLRKDEWISIDQQVKEVYRQRLRAWADIAAASTYTLDGMMKTVLEDQQVSDAGEAVVDMWGDTEARADRSLFTLQGVPLPFTHSSFHFTDRMINISRGGGESLDTRQARYAARKVSELIEKTAIGVVAGLQYGTSTNYRQTAKVYGLMNFPYRSTKSDLTAPTGSNGTTILTEWLAVRELLFADNCYGPFMCYTSAGWDQYLDNLFSTTEPSAGTLRSRLLQVGDFSGIRRLDYLGTGYNYTMLMVQMTGDVLRAVIGMPIQTIQWDSMGGSRKNFRVVTIMAPQLFADYDGRSGIAHAKTASLS